MKKFILPVAALTFLMMSCGGYKDKKKEEGPALCDCVNMKKDADDKTKEACKEMEQEWKDKYEKANDDEKKKMMDEIMACEGK